MRSIRAAIVAFVVALAWLQLGEASTGCHTTIGGAGGPYWLLFCTSNHGNITRLEAVTGSGPGVPFNHIGSGGDGYALCSGISPDTTPITHGWDAAGIESGFGAPAIKQPKGPNTLPLIIARNTTDGVFRLEQSFAFSRPNRTITITMKVTNRTMNPVGGVVLSRYFDGDIGGDNADDRYDQGFFGVWAQDRVALILAGVGEVLGAPVAVPQVHAWSTWQGSGSQTACLGESVSTPTPPGDYVGRVNYYLGTIPPKKLRTVKFAYQVQ